MTVTTDRNISMFENNQNLDGATGSLGVELELNAQVGICVRWVSEGVKVKLGGGIRLHVGRWV